MGHGIESIIFVRKRNFMFSEILEGAIGQS